MTDSDNRITVINDRLVELRESLKYQVCVQHNAEWWSVQKNFDRQLEEAQEKIDRAVRNREWVVQRHQSASARLAQALLAQLRLENEIATLEAERAALHASRRSGGGTTQPSQPSKDRQAAQEELLADLLAIGRRLAGGEEGGEKHD